MLRDERLGRKFVTRLVAATALLTAITAVARPAAAQIGSDRYSSIVVDAATGTVLEAANPDAPRRPASLVKLMTLYMVFEALRDRRIGLEQYVPVSAYAASMQPTKLGLMPGSRLTVEEAILGLVTKSANDAAAALGEMLGGSEDRFAQMMTLRARALGMSQSTFSNASGLPDPDQWSTARDMAKLARRLLIDFPSFYSYFSAPSFTYGRRVFFNHDRMLQTYPGADGMKTGYTVASGHNLVTSAVHSGVRLIGVVLGASSNPERDAHMAALLNQGFEQMDVAPERRMVVASRMPALVSSAQAATLALQPARQVSRPTASSSSWAIQVGSFGTERAAREAAGNARRAADGDGEVRIEASRQRGKVFWRAQVTGLSSGEAQGACNALTRQRAACVVFRAEPRQVASR